jgi:hypothetical protein
VTPDPWATSRAPDSRGSRRQRLSRTRAKGPQVLVPPGQSSDPVDRPRLRAPAHLTSFNPKSQEIPVEGNSGAPVSFDVSQGERLTLHEAHRLASRSASGSTGRRSASSRSMSHGCDRTWGRMAQLWGQCLKDLRGQISGLMRSNPCLLLG